MRSLLLLLLLVITCSMCVEQKAEVSTKNYCDKLWRYDIKCAVKYMFTEKELEKISGIGEKVKGRNCRETVWKTLEWIDENIEYDQQKAALPPPEIVISPLGVEIVSGKERHFQTPSETVLLRKGICSDYAILTAALLIYNKCPAYIANVSFVDDDEGHMAAVVIVYGSYYFLDQHLPPLDEADYYKKWLEDGRKIKQVTLYSTDGSNVTISNFSSGHTMTKMDSKILESLVSKIMEGKGLKKDWRLGETLPPGYRNGKIITYTFPKFAEFYSPDFRMELADYIVRQLTKSVSLNNFRSFNVDIQRSGGDLIIKLYLAS